MVRHCLEIGSQLVKEYLRKQTPAAGNVKHWSQMFGGRGPLEIKQLGQLLYVRDFVVKKS